MNTLENLRFLPGLISIILLSLLIVWGSQPVAAEVVLGDELVMEVGYIQLNVKNVHIDSFFQVLLDQNENIYLPLSRVLQQMELYLFNFNWQDRYISGVIPPEADYYYFNLQNGLIEKTGEQSFIPKDLFFIRDQEVYIHYRALGEWLPIEVSWDSYLFELYIYPNYELVSEVFNQREAVREQLDSAEIKTEETKDIIRVSPTLFTPGVVNYQLKVLGNEQLIYPGVSMSYVGQLLYGDYSGQLEYYSDGKLKFSSTQLKYWDVLGLKSLVLGDNLLEFSPLVASTVKVKGVTVESDADRFKFGVSSLSGYVPPGSDVELYYLGLLVDYQSAPDGIYHFEDIPLNNSFNEYKVMVYTKEGRIYSEDKSILSQEQLLLDGRYAYVGGFGLGSDGVVGAGEVYYGLNSRLTVGGMIDLYQGQEMVEKYLGGVLLSQINPDIFLYLNTTMGIEPSGFGYLGEITTIPDDWMIKGRIKGYHGITPPSREHIVANNRFHYLDQELSVEVKKGFGRSNLGLEYDLANFFGVWRQKINTRFTQQISLQTMLELENSLMMMTGVEPTISLKGEISYSGWSVVDLQADSQLIFNKLSLSSYNLTTRLTNKKDANNPLSYSLGLTLGDGMVNLVGSAQYNLSDQLFIKGTASMGGFSLGLTLQDTRSLQSPFKKISSDAFGTGYVKGRVYLDYNGNGRFDQDEKTFSKARILVDEYPGAKTDENGDYRLEGLNVYQPIKVALDVTSIDALYIPIQEEYWVELRPGTGLNLDFGLVPCSGLSGTIRGLNQNGVDNVELIMQDTAGEIVYRSLPEYDGFFLIERIEPRSYTLQVNIPEDAGYSVNPDAIPVEIPFGEMPMWFDELEFSIVR